MRASNIEQSRFEPTVLGAVRRYRGTVLVVALACSAAAILATLVQPELYRATATVTVPQSLLAEEQDSEQYLDSQVLLLRSRDVATRAVRIGNGALGEKVLAEDDFSGDESLLEITPPEGAAPDTYGASLVTVTFTWPDARTAQVGANAVLQAFDDVRSRSIEAEGEARVAGIERAIADARTRGQLADLVNQRTEALVDQEVDLARHPTIAWAVRPTVPATGNVKRAAAIGLLLGTVLGAAVAFARASRRRRFDDPLDPGDLYGAHLIGEIPAPGPTVQDVVPETPVRDLPMSDAPDTAEAEAYRFTAGSIERIRVADGPRLSLVFVSAGSDGGRSEVVANTALAVAESGARVLAVDAEPDGHVLTGLLLPDCGPGDGLAQVLSGQLPAAACIEPSPLHERVAVLGSGETTSTRVTGAAYGKAMREVLEEAKAEFDVVLVDSAPFQRVASASELVDVSDAAVVVLGPEDGVREHMDMVDRLDRLGATVVGYVFRHMRRHRTGLVTYLRRLRSALATATASARALAPAERQDAEPDPAPPEEEEPGPHEDEALSPVLPRRR